MRVTALAPLFLEQAPAALEHGTIYISMPFRTSVHLCCCGCGSEVWLPIRPDRYTITYDGDHVSFSPSVGNWQFACRSHYWIWKNKVIWHADRLDSAAAPERWWRSVLKWFGLKARR